MITQSNISEKQETILHAALGLFVEYGFQGTPTSKIAAEAGIAHGTLFHYYKTKDELIISLYNYVKGNLRSYIAERIDVTASLKERLRSVFYYSVLWSLSFKDEFHFTQQFQYSPYGKVLGADAEAKELSMHRVLYNEAIQTGVFQPLPIEMIAELGISQMVGIFNYINNSGITEEEQTSLINMAFELFWKMLI